MRPSGNLPQTNYAADAATLPLHAEIWAQIPPGGGSRGNGKFMPEMDDQWIEMEAICSCQVDIKHMEGSVNH